MGNVVIVTHWLDGDVIPFIRIGKELLNRGHNVTLITHCFFEQSARKAGLDFAAWDTPEEYNELVNDMSSNSTDETDKLNYSFSDNSFRQKYENTDIRLKEYRIVMEHCTDPDTVIVCKNRSSTAAYLAAEKCRLPLALVMMNPSEITSMLLYEQLNGKNDVDRLNDLRKQTGLPEVSSWLQWESSAKMTLALWPEWFDRTHHDWPAVTEAVGFPVEIGKEIYDEDIPDDFRKWIDKNPSPVVITGGTTKCLPEDFYSRSVEACSMSGRPAVVLTRYRELLPQKLPDNIKWFDYLPLDRIMNDISLLIHHGGIGTVSGALRAGKPQLILPCYLDRPYNASVIKNLNAGDFLFRANWNPDKILEKINLLSGEDISEKCRFYSEKMKENHGITAAASKIEELMKDDKYIYTINDNIELPRARLKKENSILKSEIKNKMSREQLLKIALKSRKR